jgi:hypothetical protein
VSDITTLQVKSGDVTSINILPSEVTNLLGTPATITLERILTMSDEQPFDIARIPSAGVLELASRADHVHSAAGLLLDGGNY